MVTSTSRLAAAVAPKIIQYAPKVALQLQKAELSTAKSAAALENAFKALSKANPNALANLEKFVALHEGNAQKAVSGLRDAILVASNRR